MIIESGIIYRSIAAQNEFSFKAVITNSTVSGISNFGISGDQGNFNLFQFNSGKIIDFNNRYVWSFNPREEINISGNIGSGYINYFINNNPVCLFSPHGDFYYKNFYLDTINSTLDFDLFLEGLIPDYEIIYPNNIGSTQSVTGYIKNISSPVQRSFKILSGDLFNLNLDYSFSQIFSNDISGNQSGIFVLEPSLNNQVNETTVNALSINFWTNFGVINSQLNYNVNPEPIYFTDFITGYTGELGLIDNFTLEKFYNYKLQSISPVNRNVSVVLENFSGHTGEILYGRFNASGNISGIFSKFIYGFDYITGRITGSGISVIDRDYYNNLPTGIVGENFSILQTATGFIDYTYNLPLFGASGTGFSPSGTVITGSGFLTGGFFSGFTYGYNKLFTTGNVNITGYYINEEGTNIKSGDGNFFILTGFTGNFYKDYSQSEWSTELVEGNRIVGIFNTYYGPGSLIIGVTGQRYFQISGFESSGVYSFDTTVLRNQSTGIYLKPLINLNSQLFISSGAAAVSEEQLFANDIFTGQNYSYFTGETGWALFDFTGFSSPSDKNGISHISFELDKNTLFFPKNVTVEISINGTNFSVIYTGDLSTLNLYDNNKYYLSNNLFTISNATNQFRYARYRFDSREVWPHQFSGNLEIEKNIGIKNLQFYHGYLVSRVTGDNLVYQLNFDTMTGYFENSGYNPQNFSGEVFYTRDSSLFPAWNAFNKDKTNYPYAQLIEDENYDIFLGYKTLESLPRNLTGFRIEFPSSEDIPPYYSVEYSNDGDTYYKAFVRTGNVNLIETGFFKVATGYQYFRVNLSPKSPCVYSPGTGHPCYNIIIDNNPECCSALWDSGCQEKFQLCTGLSFPYINPPIYTPPPVPPVPPFLLSGGWSSVFYTGDPTENIEEYYISSTANTYSIKNTNNIFISTGNGASGTFKVDNPFGSLSLSNFKSSANGNKLVTSLSSPYFANYTAFGRAVSTTDFTVKTLGSSSGEWSTKSGLYNTIFYDERYLLGKTGKYDIFDGTLILNADDIDISNNGNHIIFYKYNVQSLNTAILGYDLDFNYVDTYFGFINNNTYVGLTEEYNTQVPFSGLKIADNGRFAGLCGNRALDEDFYNGPNYIFTGQLFSRTPMLRPELAERTDPFQDGTNSGAIILLQLSKLNGSCVTVAAKSGRLITSKNFGLSWATGIGITQNYPWRKLLMSDSGRHQFAIFSTGVNNYYSNNTSPVYSGYGIFTSNNSGTNWSYLTGGAFLVDYSISTNGKYVGFIHKNNLLSTTGILYTSNNYGSLASFSGSLIIETGKGLGNLDMQQVKVSNNGIYLVKSNQYLLNKTIL